MKEHSHRCHCQVFSADTAMPGLKQEVIVLVGYPGCGKSTFAEKIAKEHGYGIVNRDSMKTWQKCVQNAKIYLQKGQSVIIDNTNGDTESRFVVRTFGLLIGKICSHCSC